MSLSLEVLEAELELLAAGAFLAEPADLVAAALPLLTPPELISTTDCAARYRLIPNPEGTGSALWSADLTPYINGIQDALDDPEVGLVVVPKPARTGGTVAAENYLFKRLKFGPYTDVLWYLPSDSEVDSYVNRHVSKMFELHSDIQAKVGKRRSDDKLKFKRVGGRIIEWLQLNNRTITGRTGGIVVGDEIDAASRKLRGTFVNQAKIRGTTLGSRFKGYLCSHMDAGWTDGIAAAWKESSRGIWYWPCPHCQTFSSPCPTAPKGRRMKLEYDRRAGLSDDDLLDLAEATAGVVCPHCGDKAAELHKAAMLAAGKWVHEGQEIDAAGNITGEPRSKRVMGFWIHGTMSPWVSWPDLARTMLAALLHFERTKKPEKLREATAKVLGEVYEGASASGRVVDPQALMERVPEELGTPTGIVPDWCRFVTASVDVGGSKFDVLIRGWDLEGRSHVIERFTLRQRDVVVGGKRQPRDIRTAERDDDWLVLEEHVLNRILPLESDPSMRMPVVGMAIDTGDGHVTWKAREFARRMARKGQFWGSAANPWHKVRLIKGAKAATAPELPVKPREVNVDERGQKVAPSVFEYDLGVYKLKELALERLAETEGGPGQVTFATGLPRSTFEELAGEALIDGSWERRGPNETLDLMAYDEAVRQMLRPERADIKWETRPPPWARPVPIEDEDDDEPEVPAEVAAKQKLSPIDRLAALNRR